MQRHTSAKKEARKSKKANVINSEMRSRIKTAVRHVLEAKNKKTGLETLRRAFSILDKSVKTSLIHANNAANKKARLSSFVNRLAK
jgi:small subunit ribosomal protein S20